ncbi:MAG: FAD binding domain-containing protein [Acidobacteriia bacterium]|nr:FAD binding domain-containing protein [Terriglobia bacterium]
MLMNLRKYYRPRSLEAAVQLLSANPARCLVLAGGTYLVPSGRRDVEELVDISALKLKVMKQDAAVIRIGATVALETIIDNPRMRKFAGGIMRDACRANSASRMIRNQRTLGGEICSPLIFSDVAPVLSVLDSRVKFVNFSMEEKELPIAEFWVNLDRHRSKKEPQGYFSGLITEVSIPLLPKTSSAAFERIAQIPSQPSLLSAAAVIHWGEGGVCSEARVALGSYRGRADRLAAVEDALKGKALTRESIEAACGTNWTSLSPVSDNRASEAYRSAAAPSLVRRTLERCLKGK